MNLAKPETRKPNPKMRALIASNLIRVNGLQQLKFFMEQDNAEFTRLLTQSFIGASLQKRSLMNVQLYDHPGPNVLEIHRLTSQAAPDEQTDSACEAGHTAMVTIRCRHLLLLPTPQEIQDALGVSPMEAVAVRGLVDGLTAEEQAARRDVSAETVRWHIKNVYVRLQCAGRAELAQLVLGLTRTTFHQADSK